MLCSRCVRARTVPGRRRLGATQRPADRADTQGAVHTGACGAHQRHQPGEAALHEPVRMPGLQEAAAYWPHLHFPPHAQDQQEPRLLDTQGCRPALRHQVNGGAGPLRSLLTRELTVQGTKTHDPGKFCCSSANIYRLLLKFVMVKWDNDKDFKFLLCQLCHWLSKITALYCRILPNWGVVAFRLIWQACRLQWGLQSLNRSDTVCEMTQLGTSSHITVCVKWYTLHIVPRERRLKNIFIKKKKPNETAGVTRSNSMRRWALEDESSQQCQQSPKHYWLVEDGRDQLGHQKDHFEQLVVLWDQWNNVKKGEIWWWNVICKILFTSKDTDLGKRKKDHLL